jgi:LacI family transcriptional regulator
MYTIRDVARLANVSISTASGVINGKPTVKEALRLRVIAAMEALDYHPDTVARSLKVRRTKTIGIVVPEITNPFYPEIIQGMEDVANQSGYSVMFCDSGEDRDLEHAHLSMLFSRRVDGVLIAPADPYGARDRLTRQRIPFVLFDRVPRGFPGPGVIIDNFEASRNAARYLIGLGHERNAVVAWLPNLPAMVDRVDGFRQALQEQHLPISEEYFRWVDFSLESAYQCGLELMRLPEPPTAIFCCNNRMTLGVMRALGGLGIPCPELVSVLGFDDFDWAANITPRLTTVAQPTYEMGRQAMQLLMQKMAGAKDDLGTEGSHLIVLQCELRVRDSTAPPCQARVGGVSPQPTPGPTAENLKGLAREPVP